MKKNVNTLPFVSVIVPVYNDMQRINSCIKALMTQTYEAENYEVLVVDNGSTDGTRDMVQQYPVTLLMEDTIQGSYAARNKGIKHAKGEVIVFTDSDCIPVPRWIAEGVNGLQQQGADLCSGNVRFVYSPNPSGAEIFDSITNMQIEKNIRERKVSKTANLFVRSRVFKSIGLFPANPQSGGDVIWTGQATRQGRKLVYAPQAEVAHPARRLGAMMKKQYRVGKGQPVIWTKTAVPKLEYLRSTLNNFLPFSLSNIRNRMEKRRINISRIKLWRTWFAAWLCQIATALGNVVTMIGLYRHDNIKV